MTPEQKAAITDYLHSCRNRRFSLGEWDCAMFAADVVRCLTGEEVALAEEMRGKYSHDYLQKSPAPMRDLPELCGLVPCPKPSDGAIWWAPWPRASGSLGIVWQAQLLAPGKRGLVAVKLDISTLKFYTPCPKPLQ